MPQGLRCIVRCPSEYRGFWKRAAVLTGGGGEWGLRCVRTSRDGTGSAVPKCSPADVSGCPVHPRAGLGAARPPQTLGDPGCGEARHTDGRLTRSPARSHAQPCDFVVLAPGPYAKQSVECLRPPPVPRCPGHGGGGAQWVLSRHATSGPAGHRSHVIRWNWVLLGPAQDAAVSY